jgi:IS1 family transposase
LVGKRDGENANAFLADLRQRIVNRPEISSDGFSAYPDAVERAFGVDWFLRATDQAVSGRSGIAYVERGNLSVRMALRRFTRLTNGFSKKLENHIAAVSLYVADFNLCRVHEALRVTPAMAMGITDHIWSIGELVDAATAEPMEQQAA